MTQENKTQENKLEIVSVPTDDKQAIEITPFGSDERIKLSVSIIQKLIAVPTRTGKIPDANACIKFMMLCRARHLNPFEGDAFMLGYDTQSGPQFSLITAHQVFLKRAEASHGFKGMQSGVIVRHQDEVVEREGDITFQSEELLGGWAKVYRKDREHPFYRRLKLSTFNTGRSRWEKDPAGMIVKCAEADALRSAFPSHLGGLYVEEERPPIDISAEPVIKEAKVPKIKDFSGSASSSEDEGDKRRMAATAEEGTAPKPVEVNAEANVRQSNSGNVKSGVTAGETAPSKKKLKLKKSSPSTRREQLEKQMLEHLNLGSKTPNDLLKVAVANDWCGAEEKWPLTEEKLELFLEPDNWEVLMEGMDAQ